jgi:hypothetical protein
MEARDIYPEIYYQEIFYQGIGGILSGDIYQEIFLYQEISRIIKMTHAEQLTKPMQSICFD